MSTHAEPDWAALARSPQFRELMASRRRFLVAGTAFYSLYFLAYLCLLGFAPDTMGKYLFGSVSYALAGGMSLVRAGLRHGLPARAQVRGMGADGAQRARRRARPDEPALHQGPGA